MVVRQTLERLATQTSGIYTVCRVHGHGSCALTPDGPTLWAWDWSVWKRGSIWTRRRDFSDCMRLTADLCYGVMGAMSYSCGKTPATYPKTALQVSLPNSIFFPMHVSTVHIHNSKRNEPSHHSMQGLRGSTRCIRLTWR
jgi:hypothetical protein